MAEAMASIGGWFGSFGQGAASGATGGGMGGVEGVSGVLGSTFGGAGRGYLMSLLKGSDPYQSAGLGALGGLRSGAQNYSSGASGSSGYDIHEWEAGDVSAIDLATGEYHGNLTADQIAFAQSVNAQLEEDAASGGGGGGGGGAGGGGLKGAMGGLGAGMKGAGDYMANQTPIALPRWQSLSRPPYTGGRNPPPAWISAIPAMMGRTARGSMPVLAGR